LRGRVLGRFDLVSVLFRRGQVASVEHVENVIIGDGDGWQPW